jgi:ribosomal-protein-alanine N-acetyltransferase
VSGRFALRPLGALDLDLAARLHGDCFVPMGERGWTRQDMAELLASPGAAGVILQLDGKEIGFAACRVAADEAELLTIAVRADHRRCGAGRALLAAVVECARSGGACTLFLEVGVDNPAALALYGQAGFQGVGRRAGYYRRAEGVAADAILMSLDLRLGAKRGG